MSPLIKAVMVPTQKEVFEKPVLGLDILSQTFDHITVKFGNILIDLFKTNTWVET